MEYLFIINPTAGQRNSKKIKDILVTKISSNKKYKEYKYNILTPLNPFNLYQKIRNEIMVNNVSSVIAVGGDGTISAVIQVIIDYPEVSLGIIPQGTGNILASNLGISNEIDKALEIIFSGNTKQIDLGLVDKKPFIIMAGTGLPAEIIQDLKQEEKVMFGIWAYFIKGLEHLYSAKEFSFNLNIDGKEINTKSIAVFVSNAGNFMGPLPTITPQAEPTDGYLDVFIVSLKSLREDPVGYFELLVNYLTRSIERGGKLQSYKAKKIRINSIPSLKVQADGDIVSETPTEIEILPKKLKVLVPSKGQSFIPSLSFVAEKIEEMFNL